MKVELGDDVMSSLYKLRRLNKELGVRLDKSIKEYNPVSMGVGGEYSRIREHLRV